MSDGDDDTPPPPAAGKPHDLYGFEIDEEDVVNESTFNAEYTVILQRRAARWKKYLDKLERDGKTIEKNDKLKKLVRKGIPHQHRPRVWREILGADKLRADHPAGYYHHALAESEGRDNEDIRQIGRDLHRTFPGHPVLNSMACLEHLRRVLTAYAYHNPKVGYCQSMNFVAALLLMVVGQNEEEAFWLLVGALKELPVDYYSKNMVDSTVDQRAFSDLVKSKLSKLYKILDKMSVPLPLISAQWFLCLYVGTTPTETTLRIWDSFFLEGAKVLFRVALALIKIQGKKLERMHKDKKDMGEVFMTVKNGPAHCFDCDKLMKVAFDGIGSLGMKDVEKARLKHYGEVLAEFEERKKYDR